MMEFCDIETKVVKALNNFLEQEAFLLKHNVHERSITHKLAEHLQDEFPNSNYHVDCEYNRKTAESGDQITKTVDDIKVFPDIIVHRRENSDENLLTIEVKKLKNERRFNDRSYERDKWKIKEYLSRFNFEFGLLIGLVAHKQKPICHCYFLKLSKQNEENPRNKKFFEGFEEDNDSQFLIKELLLPANMETKTPHSSAMDQ